nr:unnamed protein product [Callosobruchus chinensis]
MSGDKKWNTENTCKLIELYREHSILWDPKNKDYKNRYKKADALKKISLSLNVPLNDVDKKIKNINNQCARERRNYKKLKKSGAGKHFTPKWFGYELLSFLRDKNKPRKSLQAGCSGETHVS